MASGVSYYYIPTAPRAVPAVVTMPVRQIYIMPRASVPTTSFWPNFAVKAVPTMPSAKAANVPLARPVAAATRRAAPLCLLIDVRGEDRASGHIEGSVHEPTSFQAPLLNRVPELVAKFSKERLVIFHCQYSLHRGPQCANWYREQAPTSQRVAVLEGGFRGWEGQRLPVLREQPMDAHSQGKADIYALSMGRRLAGAGA
eukprot:s8060_g3.t1